MTSLRHILLGLMVALVAVTAQSAAVARTMPDAAGQMVICTGTSPVMVYVDEDGNPTSAPHICPDYALSLIVALDAPVADHDLPAFVRMRLGAADALPLPAVRLGTPKARAPPRFV